MNFVEFKKNVDEMECELQEKNVNPENVKIEYTRLDGRNCLWAMNDDNVVAYFKW